MTKEDGLHSEEKHVIYAASKKYAELAVWEWAEAHPHVDVTTSKSINYIAPPPCLTNVIEQSSHLTSTVHSQTSFFHFLSLNTTSSPVLS